MTFNEETLKNEMQKEISDNQIELWAMAIELQAYNDRFLTWLMTEPPKWRIKKHRKWREKKPKREDFMERARELEKLQIDLKNNIK